MFKKNRLMAVFFKHVMNHETNTLVVLVVMLCVLIMAIVYIVCLEFECESCTGRERNAARNHSYKGIYIHLLIISLHNIPYKYL